MRVTLILRALIRIPLIHNSAAESKMTGFFDGYYFRITEEEIIKELTSQGKSMWNFKDV